MWIFLKKKKNFLYLLSSVFYVLFFALTFFSLTKTEVWEVPGWINLGERFIISIALCVNFIGDGLRDAFDPRQRRRITKKDRLQAKLQIKAGE